MSSHKLFQTTKELSADEDRGELRQFDGAIAGAADYPEKLVGEGGLVLFIDGVNCGVDAQPEQQALHHVAHAAPAPGEHNNRILRDHVAQPRREQHRVVAVAARIGRAAASSAAGGGGEVVVRGKSGTAVHGVCGEMGGGISGDGVAFISLEETKGGL